MSAESSDGRWLAELVVEHFRPFLQSSTRPCFRLTASGEVIELPHERNWWAAFGIDRSADRSGDDHLVRPVNGDNEIDLIGMALDRLALAHFRLGEPKFAADALVTALLSPSRCSWDHADLTRLHGWIGWLYFDAGDYRNAAAFLRQCWEEIPEDGDSDGLTRASRGFMRLTEWYMMLGSLPNNTVLHAFTEMGDGTNFLPSGSLAHGCDAFLTRLAASCSAVGTYQEALAATDFCIRFSIPQSDSGYEAARFPEARLLHAALSLECERRSSCCMMLRRWSSTTKTMNHSAWSSHACHFSNIPRCNNWPVRQVICSTKRR
jgi:tetratricopeptide (TPR) repeat protein